MKKTFSLLLTVILTMAIFTGCRRQLDGHPGDPTVNNSSTTESTRVTIPSITTRPTESTSTPDTSSTIPFGTDAEPTGTTENGLIPSESTTINNPRNRAHMLPRN